MLCEAVGQRIDWLPHRRRLELRGVVCRGPCRNGFARKARLHDAAFVGTAPPTDDDSGSAGTRNTSEDFQDAARVGRSDKLIGYLLLSTADTQANVANVHCRLQMLKN